MMCNSQAQIVCKKEKVEFYDFKTSNSIHLGTKIFKIKISDYLKFLPQLTSVLNSKEKLRADRYYDADDCNRFVISRSLLKFVLATELSLDVSEIKLTKGEDRKPYLAAYPDLYFNISHSKNYIIIALDKIKLGLDVEHLADDFDFLEILSTVFSQLEIDEILKAKDKKQMFYTFWTRKEAVVKATGQGIDDGFIKIGVMDGCNLVSTDVLGSIKNMQVISFDVDDDYIGAVALEGEKIESNVLKFYDINYFIKDLVRF